MKFRYIGDCEGMTFRGLDFPIDKPVEVESEEVIAKLQANSHFKEVKGRNKAGDTDGDSGGNKG